MQASAKSIMSATFRPCSSYPVELHSDCSCTDLSMSIRSYSPVRFRPVRYRAELPVCGTALLSFVQFIAVGQVCGSAGLRNRAVHHGSTQIFDNAASCSAGAGQPCTILRTAELRKVVKSAVSATACKCENAHFSAVV